MSNEVALTTGQSGKTMLVVSAGPHIRNRESVLRMMLITLAALAPALAVSVALYGVRAALMVTLGVAAAAATEMAFLLVENRRFAMIDGSALLTGLLLAFSLPPTVPLWLAPIGAAFAIAIVKMAFGGLGRNFLNPALAGRALLALSFPAAFVIAPPQALSGTGETLLNLLVGYQGGWTGGASAGALIIGAALVWGFRIIDFSLPLSFIGSGFLLFWLAGGNDMPFTSGALVSALCRISSGGLLLGALFMATDPATSPVTGLARLLFGAGCGALTFLFAKFGNANDGVMYAILLMNCLAPYLDRYCGRQPYGASKIKKRRRRGLQAISLRSVVPLSRE